MNWTEIHEGNTNRSEIRNGQIHNYGSKVQQSSCNQWDIKLGYRGMQKKKINQPIEINSHVFRTVHSKTEDCTFFWGAYKTCQGRQYFSSKANFKLFKRTEIISTVFTDHNEIKLESNNRKITKDYINN